MIVVSRADPNMHTLFGFTHVSDNGLRTVCGEAMDRQYLWVPCRTDEPVTCDRCKRLSQVPTLKESTR